MYFYIDTVAEKHFRGNSFNGRIPPKTMTIQDKSEDFYDDYEAEVEDPEEDEFEFQYYYHHNLKKEPKQPLQKHQIYDSRNNKENEVELDMFNDVKRYRI